VVKREWLKESAQKCAVVAAYRFNSTGMLLDQSLGKIGWIKQGLMLPSLLQAYVR